MKQQFFLTKAPVHSLLALEKGTQHRWNINDPQFRHRAVMGLFGEISTANPRESGNILFRLDQVPGEAPFFLIQSSLEPLPLQEELGIITKKLSHPTYSTGDIIQFRTTVNAIRRKSITVNGRRRYEVTPVPFEVDAESDKPGFPQWLNNKLNSALADVDIISHRRTILGAKSRSTMTLQLDEVDGVAKVVNPEALSVLMHVGIGREKAYGCGLFSTRTLQTA